jgi:hypothetical protein
MAEAAEAVGLGGVDDNTPPLNLWDIMYYLF